MNKFWNIPIITVYLYAVAILTQHGFNSYFNIPSNFIEFSIKENIVYFFQLFQLALAIVGVMKFWMWIVVLVGAIVIAILCFFDYVYEIIFTSILIGGALVGSYYFGNFLAINTSTFYVPLSDCQLIGQGKYIIPVFYDSKAILVSIDENNKLGNGFMVKEMSDLSCKIELKNIGKIIK
jgi:hypothetical protein